MSPEFGPGGPAAAFQAHGDGLRIRLRLTPKSTLDAITGHGQSAHVRSHLKARVRAVPDNGQANAVLIKLVAQLLDVPASGIRCIAGATSRLKAVLVAGDGAALAARLSAFLSSDGGKSWP